MLGWCIVTLASARLKASVRFPSLRGMYQRGGTCKGCDILGPSRCVDSDALMYKHMCNLVINLKLAAAKVL